MKRAAQISVQLPSAPVQYEQANEQAFRRSVEQALGDAAPNLREQVFYIRVPYSAPRPAIDTETFSIASGYLHPGATATRTYQCGVDIPENTEIFALSGRLYIEGGSDLVNVALWQGDDTTALATKIAEVTASATATWSTVEDTSSPLPVVAGGELYTLVVQLDANTTATHTRFLYALIACRSS